VEREDTLKNKKLFLVLIISFLILLGLSIYFYEESLEDNYLLSSDMILFTDSRFHCIDCQNDADEEFDFYNCAGGIATGTVVKNNRSIFWKNRHYSGEKEKPRFEHGPVYDYWMNTGTSWGMNEVGLAVGNFMQYGTLNNWQYYSTATYGQTYGIQSYLLGHFSTVAEAAYFAAYHMGGKSSLGIVSAEPGVGAVVYSGVNSAGQQVCAITWVNDSFMALSNAYECDGSYDSKWYDAQARLQQSYVNHGFIDWADVIQKGARDVKGREQGSGAFTSCCVSKSNSLSSIIAVSGNPRWNGSSNIAWTCLARQPLVGIYLPLGSSYLQYSDERDMPAVFRVGGGMEDYVTAKVLYATNGAGQGSNTYYAEKVREIQDYTFQIENYSFLLYDQYVASLHENMTQSTVETKLKSYVDTIVPQMMSAYVNETYISTGNTPPIVVEIPNQTITVGHDFSPIFLYDYVTDNEDSASNITWTFSGCLELSIEISNNTAYITIPHPQWKGQETILFTAKDTGNLTDSNSVVLTVVSPNNPPFCLGVFPLHEATIVSTSIDTLIVTIHDNEGDSFQWSIETQPNIGSEYGYDEMNGSKICSISGLLPSTTYTWFVNATDGFGWMRNVYFFSTENLVNLTVLSIGNGIIEKNPEKLSYSIGTNVELAAYPDNGWSFEYWDGDISGDTNPIIINVTMNATVIACFTKNQHTLTVLMNGSGSVIKDPDNITYYYGDDVILYAVASDGWSFDSWAGIVTGTSNPIMVTINGNTTLTVHFYDSNPPVISELSYNISDPSDTDPLFGWVNISCRVIDNIAVSNVHLIIQRPDGFFDNVTMQVYGSGHYYYQSSVAFSSVGNYSYHIRTSDTHGNINTSNVVLFSILPNWDINEDGYCTILDFVLVSNRYYENGDNGWIREDVDNNGIISLSDMIYISNHYGQYWW